MAEIQDTLSRHAPIVRDGGELQAGLDKVAELAERAKACGTGGSNTKAFNPGWHTAYDIRSMLVNAEALFRSAIERKESRGAHARLDFPKLDDEGMGKVNFIVFRSDEGMKVKSEKIAPMPDYLQEAVHHGYARYTPEERE
jgi:succinate dehydrogenase / fumarate reductase flavoprotein subunit